MKSRFQSIIETGAVYFGTNTMLSSQPETRGKIEFAKLEMEEEQRHTKELKALNLQIGDLQWRTNGLLKGQGTLEGARKQKRWMKRFSIHTTIAGLD